MLLPAGVSCPFEYTMFDADETRFIAMEVWDASDDSLVVTLPMLHKSKGTYVASFTPVDGTAYYTNKSVYTDGTYATVDDAYAPASESFVALDFSNIGSGGGGGATIIHPPDFVGTIMDDPDRLVGVLKDSDDALIGQILDNTEL